MEIDRLYLTLAMKEMRESRDGKANGEAEVLVLLAVGSRDGAVVTAHQCGSGMNRSLLYILVCCLTGS